MVHKFVRKMGVNTLKGHTFIFKIEVMRCLAYNLAVLEIVIPKIRLIRFTSIISNRP